MLGAIHSDSYPIALSQDLGLHAVPYTDPILFETKCHRSFLKPNNSFFFFVHKRNRNNVELVCQEKMYRVFVCHPAMLKGRLRAYSHSPKIQHVAL